jgi:hypothetical protein
MLSQLPREIIINILFYAGYVKREQNWHKIDKIDKILVCHYDENIIFMYYYIWFAIENLRFNNRLTDKKKETFRFYSYSSSRFTYNHLFFDDLDELNNTQYY